MNKVNDYPARKYISPIYINGMQGRMLRLPQPNSKNREILVVYGQSIVLEDIYRWLRDLNKYAGVTVADLPGFGGMQSFYKIGEKPTLENFADYLAAFIKLRYSRRRLVIFGLSFGFTVVTRMLQEYPELAKKIDFLIGINGYVNHEDLKITGSDKLLARTTSKFFSGRLSSSLGRWAIPNHLNNLINVSFLNTSTKIGKFKKTAKHPAELRSWQQNDLRTQMAVASSMLKLNICNQTIKVPMYYLITGSQSKLNRHILEQHLNVIFSEVYMVKAKMPSRRGYGRRSSFLRMPLLPKAVRLVL